MYKLNPNLYVPEGVNNSCKEIKNNPSNKIILTGGRGTGKSTVLYNYQRQSQETKSPCIYTIFDSCGLTGTKLNEIFDIRFYKHYYELTIAITLLNYIKKYYGITYENNFKKYQEYINKICKDTDNYIHNSAFKEIKLNQYLEPLLISSEILSIFKYVNDLESLEIAIDRFDWTNKNTEYTQKILREYFNLFDKTIITTDDITLLNQEERNNLQNKSYSFIDINYGKDLNIIKTIIEKRILEHNYSNKTNIKFPKEIITTEIYNYLITISNGNISLIIDILKNIISTYNWTDGTFDINNELEPIINEELTKQKQLTKMLGPKKLYL